MNVVVRSDQILATHNVQRKCLRWWKAILLNLIALAVVNCFILFKGRQRRIPEQLKRPQRYNLENFRGELSPQSVSTSLLKHPWESLMWNTTQFFFLFFFNVKKDCACTKRKIGRKRVFTSGSEPQCQVKHTNFTLHINCWQIFHSRMFHDT